VIEMGRRGWSLQLWISSMERILSNRYGTTE